MTKQALLEKAEEKSRELANILADNKTAEGFNLNEEGLEMVKSLEAEINRLHNEAETTDSEVPSRSKSMAVKSLGTLIKESGAIEQYKNQGRTGLFNLNTGSSEEGAGFKTTMATSAGWAPLDPRSGVVVPYPVAPYDVVNLIPMIEAPVAIWKYMRGTTFTNNAAAAAQAASIGEAALAYTQIDATLQKVAVTLPVTVEQLQDVPGIEGIISQELSRMVWSKINYYALFGETVSGHPEGVLKVTGTNAVSGSTYSDSAFDSIYAGITACRSTGMTEPNGVVTTPALWQKLVAKQSTAGGYLGGSPFQSPANGLWGIPAVASPQFTASVSGDAQAVVGDFVNYSNMIVHPEVMFDITDSHASEFANGIKRARLIVRVAFAWKRASAFSVVSVLAL